MPISLKTVKRRKYVYFRRFDEKQRKKIERYCGPEADPGSMRKARKLEKAYLREHVSLFQERIKELEATEREELRKERLDWRVKDEDIMEDGDQVESREQHDAPHSPKWSK